MSLLSASYFASSSLSATSAQLAVLSRNIANASDTSASRKIVNVTTDLTTGIKVLTTTRVTNSALTTAMLSANSDQSSASAIQTALTQLQNSVDDSNNPTSPSATLTAFQQALQNFATSPSDASVAQSTIAAAKNFTASLNNSANAVATIRQTADSNIAQAVSKVNSLLSQIQTVNSSIVVSTKAGGDVTDALDARDSLITQLSAQMGIKTIARANNDIAIFTDSGAPLFDVTARSVTFQASPGLGATGTGNAVMVDGVPVTGSSSPMPLQSGAIAGNAQIRDVTSVQYETQLDALAGSMVNAFSESDQGTPPTNPTLPGLLTANGLSSVPGTTIIPGLAQSITVNANVDPAQGGNWQLLRDGGISNPTNPAYTYNTTGAASFNTRIQNLANAISTSTSFDSSAGLGTNASPEDFASGSLSWLETQRQNNSNATTQANAILNQAQQALSGATGVNIDTEMSGMLDLEHSYQASSELLSAINTMFTELITTIDKAT